MLLELQELRGTRIEADLWATDILLHDQCALTANELLKRIVVNQALCPVCCGGSLSSQMRCHGLSST